VIFPQNDNLGFKNKNLIFHGIQPTYDPRHVTLKNLKVLKCDCKNTLIVIEIITVVKLDRNEFELIVSVLRFTTESLFYASIFIHSGI